MSSDPALFPVFLKLAGRKVLVVGGGAVAASKVEALVPTGARLVVVAPAIRSDIASSRAELRRRPFRASDLDGAWFVVSAATPAVNRIVSRAAARRRLFVNAVDDPPNATAYLGGVVRRAGLTLAISTSGRAPAIAGLVREGLDVLIPDDLDAWFSTSDELKRQWRKTGVPMDARRPQLLEALVNLYEERESAEAGS